MLNDAIGTAAFSPQQAGLLQSPEGFWSAATSGELSYPESGHASCLQIEDESFWFAHRNKCIGAVTKRFPPTGTFADVGGGNGFVSMELMSQGIDLVLVEPGATGARNAWERGVRPVVCARLAEAGIAPSSLGGVGLFDVVEHIEDHVAFLEEVRSYLKPGGRVYLTVPAMNFLWSNEDDEAGHFRRYSFRTLRAALETANLEIEYVSGMFAWLPLPVFLMRSIPSLLGKRRTAPAVANNEHRLPPNIVGQSLQRLLTLELRRIEAGKRVPIGGSILAVARRKN